ncbi:MAG: hypothetical protein J3R72DRAFT_492653 [Linnemannia gamsii]|nr:MAG: hypothetical protein J3R72DRAFT_492653 [Linnemannia gamsii]
MTQRTTKRQLQVYRDVNETNAEPSLRRSKRNRSTTGNQPSLASAQPTPPPVLADDMPVLRDVSDLLELDRHFAPGETIMSELMDSKPSTSPLLTATASDAHLLLALSIASQPQPRLDTPPPPSDAITPQPQPRPIIARPSLPQQRPILPRPPQPQPRLTTRRPLQLQPRRITTRPLQPQKRPITTRPPQPQRLIAPRPQPHSNVSSSPVATLHVRPRTPPPTALATILQALPPAPQSSILPALPSSSTTLPTIDPLPHMDCSSLLQTKRSGPIASSSSSSTVRPKKSPQHPQSRHPRRLRPIACRPLPQDGNGDSVLIAPLFASGPTSSKKQSCHGKSSFK